MMNRTRSWTRSVLLACQACLLFSLSWGSAFGALDVPPLTGRIVDLADLLPVEVETSLTAKLAAHEQQTGDQIAVLTLPSLEGEPLEEYAHRVAVTWQLGRKGIDNGLLLLVVPKERRIRIEVGYGLEGKLTDAAASRIIRNVIVPRFRAGDFSGGIGAGVTAILERLEGSEGASAPPRAEGNETWNSVLIAVVLGTVIGALIGRPLRWLGSAIGGFLAFLMTLPAGWLAAVAAALLGALAALAISALLSGTRRAPRHWEEGWGPDWTSGFGRGGSSSSDSFIGGGGDFGGGGASGRW
jgi:uncharacterized protein